MSAGLDPIILLDIAEWGAASIVQGTVNWTDAALDFFGSEIQPYLKAAQVKAMEIVRDDFIPKLQDGNADGPVADSSERTSKSIKW